MAVCQNYQANMSTFNDGYDQAMPDAGSHFPHAGEHRPTHFLSILFDFWTGGGPFSISIAMRGYDKAWSELCGRSDPRVGRPKSLI